MVNSVDVTSSVKKERIFCMTITLPEGPHKTVPFLRSRIIMQIQQNQGFVISRMFLERNGHSGDNSPGFLLCLKRANHFFGVRNNARCPINSLGGDLPKTLLNMHGRNDEAGCRYPTERPTSRTGKSRVFLRSSAALVRR